MVIFKMINWLRKKLIGRTMSPEVADKTYEASFLAYENITFVLNDLEDVPSEERDDVWLLTISRLASAEAELYYALIAILEDSEEGLAELKRLNPERYY